MVLNHLCPRCKAHEVLASGFLCVECFNALNIDPPTEAVEVFPIDHHENPAATVENSGYGDPRFHDLLKQLGDLHNKKAADYGADGDPLANIRASEEIGIPAWKGAWLRAKDKVKRINQFCLKGALENESVADSFLDLAAYSLIALLLFQEGK